jgi:hypothetical protein
MHERVAGNRSVFVAVVDQIGHSTVLLTCNRAMKMGGGDIIRRHRNCLGVEPGTVASGRRGVRLVSIRGGLLRGPVRYNNIDFGFVTKAMPRLG